MRCGILVLTLLLAACGSSAADSSRSSTTAAPRTGGPPPVARCGPVHAPTLATSGAARVYASGGAVFGCVSRTPARAVRLGQTRACLGSPRVGPVAVAGELAAYGAERCGVDTGTGSVIIRRLSDGRIVRELGAITGPVGPESFVSVAAVVLKPDGAVAWIGAGRSILSHRQRLEVLAAHADGQARLLDGGAGIDQRSLALQGSKVTWRDAGRPRSATLQ